MSISWLIRPRFLVAIAVLALLCGCETGGGTEVYTTFIASIAAVTLGIAIPYSGYVGFYPPGT